MLYISADTAQFDATALKELKFMIYCHGRGADTADLAELLEKCRSLTADFFHVPVSAIKAEEVRR